MNVFLTTNIFTVEFMSSNLFMPEVNGVFELFLEELLQRRIYPFGQSRDAIDGIGFFIVYW